MELTRVRPESVRLFSSADPTGGNEDYGHFLRDGPAGWKVMADAEGPGYLSRFWFTGAPDGRLRLRFYFDDEPAPRVETTLADWCGGADPARPPLAAYENYAWYSLLPVPFARRLVVMCEAGAAPEAKLYYQIQVQRVPEETAVESFRGEWNARERAALGRARAAWAGTASAEGEELRCEIEQAAWREVAGGGSAVLGEFEGPATLAGWVMELEAGTRPNALSRAAMLREVALEITWDETAGPSVAAPLGLGFGGWRYRASHATRGWRVDGWRFEGRWPMPFRRRARVALRNGGTQPVRFRWAAHLAPFPEGEGAPPGYFHAEYRRSGPETGAPHQVVTARGRGVYAGCVLDVAAAQPNYWILEGDESIRLDGERDASWRGTGLEDYFNGGWYYQNVVARPMHGLTFKAPFRVTQYRAHLLDRVPFRRSIEVAFERGPANETPGWMESVAFFYLLDPAPVSRAALEADAAPPRALPHEEQTIMTELANLERFGDFAGAAEHIECFLERYPGFRRAEMLHVRAALYRAAAAGNPAEARAAVERAAASADLGVRRAAEDWLWFHGEAGRALAFLFANHPATLYVDERAVLTADNPEMVARARLELGGAPRTISLAACRGPYPDWALAMVRTAEADYITTPFWRVALEAAPPARDPGRAARGWPRVGGTGVKGPPEEPYLWVEPDLFLGVLSGAIGLRAPGAAPPSGWAIFHWDADDAEAGRSIVRHGRSAWAPGRE
jgi:hypothetical protein